MSYRMQYLAESKNALFHDGPKNTTYNGLDVNRQGTAHRLTFRPTKGTNFDEEATYMHESSASTCTRPTRALNLEYTINLPFIWNTYNHCMQIGNSNCSIILVAPSITTSHTIQRWKRLSNAPDSQRHIKQIMPHYAIYENILGRQM